MVDIFMRGIDPFVFEFSISFLMEALKEFTEIMLKAGDKNANETHAFQMNSNIEKIVNGFISNMNYIQQKYYISPITNVVSVLPKDELASMAESLINLTSFKRKVSLDAETVGGPIDVAVISKGDGFIWIKRKHYFESELNPLYFINKYKGAYKYGKTEDTL
ncbi:MAG: hypothetical protein WBL02_02690 [Methanomethylovorans sp.]